MRNKLGLTFSEVLIAILVIGVVAILTIPNFIYKQNNKEFVSRYKKAFSSINKAIEINYSLDGTTPQYYKTPETLVEELFKKVMLVMDESRIEAFPGGVNCQDGKLFVTEDGMIFCVTSDFKSDNNDLEDSLCNAYQTKPCGSKDKPQLWVDLNGLKGPNKASDSIEKLNDQYQLQIYSQEIVPFDDAGKSIMMEIISRNEDKSREKTNK